MKSKARDMGPKKLMMDLDKPRPVVFDLNAFIALEEKYDSIQAALGDMQDGKVKALRTVLWAGLVAGVTDADGVPTEDIRIGQVGAWIGMVGLEKLSEQLTSLLVDSLPEEKAGKTGPQALVQSQ